MPSSIPDHIPDVLKRIQKLQPRRVLDVGIGFGKWGFLLREYLETWHDRVHPDSWKTEIHGVEVWEPYTKLPWIETLYNKIFNEDIRSFAKEADASYDVIICGDVIEHLPKTEAIDVLKRLLRLTRKTLVLSIPLGQEWLNNQIVDQNPYEKHRSAWSRVDIEDLGRVTQAIQFSVGTKHVGLYFLEGQYEASVPSPVVPVDRAKVDNGTILHVHNVQRCGGTGNFVYDMARCFPEFNHAALCVNDPNGDPQWLTDVSGAMRPFYAPKLTREILEEINPRIVVLHATAGRSLEGGWPYAWIQDNGRRYVISVHHTTTYPLLRADLDIFVSKHLRGYYTKIIERCGKHILMPPCMDLASLAGLPDREGELRYTSAGKHCDRLVAFARANDISLNISPPGRIGAMSSYLLRFNCAIIWSGHKETWCRTLTECMAAGLLVVGHNSGAIPEQIVDGKTGFLFENEEGLKSVLGTIRTSSEVLRRDIRTAGREWALRHAGFETMRSTLYPHMTGALVTA